MARYKYQCVTECVRTDFADILGFEGAKRFRVGDILETTREIDSPKFDLVDWTPDPPKKTAAKKTAKSEE